MHMMHAHSRPPSYSGNMSFTPELWAAVRKSPVSYLLLTPALICPIPTQARFLLRALGPAVAPQATLELACMQHIGRARHRVEKLLLSRKRSCSVAAVQQGGCAPGKHKTHLRSTHRTIKHHRQSYNHFRHCTTRIFHLTSSAMVDSTAPRTLGMPTTKFLIVCSSGMQWFSRLS